VSLDVYLTANRPCEVFYANITHNLNTMAAEAGIYVALWRPEELKISRAIELAPIVKAGLDRLRADPERFKRLNPENGWGSYETLVKFTEAYLAALNENPDAEVSVSR
jgi:hypothetical protein